MAATSRQALDTSKGKVEHVRFAAAEGAARAPLVMTFVRQNHMWPTDPQLLLLLENITLAKITRTPRRKSRRPVRPIFFFHPFPLPPP